MTPIYAFAALDLVDILCIWDTSIHCENEADCWKLHLWCLPRISICFPYPALLPSQTYWLQEKHWGSRRSFACHSAWTAIYSPSVFIPITSSSSRLVNSTFSYVYSQWRSIYHCLSLSNVDLLTDHSAKFFRNNQRKLFTPPSLLILVPSEHWLIDLLEKNFLQTNSPHIVRPISSSFSAPHLIYAEAFSSLQPVSIMALPEWTLWWTFIPSVIGIAKIALDLIAVYKFFRCDHQVLEANRAEFLRTQASLLTQHVNPSSRAPSSPLPDASSSSLRGIPYGQTVSNLLPPIHYNPRHAAPSSLTASCAPPDELKPKPLTRAS